MANQIEGLNGTRSTYVYENIEIVEIDGVRMVRRLKDKKIIGLNSQKKEMQEGYYQRQFNKSQPRYQDLALKEELTNFSSKIQGCQSVSSSKIPTSSIIILCGALCMEKFASH